MFERYNNPLHARSQTPYMTSSQCHQFLHGIRTAIFNRNFIDLISLRRPLLNLTEAHGAGKWNRDILTSLELGRIRVAATVK